MLPNLTCLCLPQIPTYVDVDKVVEVEKIVEKIEYVDKEVLIDKIVEVPKTVRLPPSPILAPPLYLSLSFLLLVRIPPDPVDLCATDRAFHLGCLPSP